jgi:glutamate/tyrosine decarboxylase-like PLP-dependent enzyme
MGIQFEKCDPKEIALKTFFLGPQAENKEWLFKVIQSLFLQWFNWREHYAPADGPAITTQNRELMEFRQKQQQLSSLVHEMMLRFENEVPKFTPRYVGHMFSEQSLPALLGQILTLLHNPNNISGEVSRVGIQVEKEAIADLNQMVGWGTNQGTGHFTSGGTIANFEGLLRAKSRVMKWLSLGTFLQEKKISNKALFEYAHMGWDEFDRWNQLIDQKNFTDQKEFTEWKTKYFGNPIRFARKVESVFDQEFEGPVLLVPHSKHYSWPKAAEILGFGSDRLIPLVLDVNGQVSVSDLQNKIKMCQTKNLPIACVVSVVGTTELGTVDPIDQICNELEKQKNIGISLWHHVDAAYGGFLCSMNQMQDADLEPLLKKLKAIKCCNSVTIDPHKLGYVPYSSGVILVRDKREYPYQDIHAPYIQFKEDKDVGLQTLEGSRSAAGAVATWLTERSIGLHADGYGSILARTIAVKNHLQNLLIKKDSRFCIVNGLDTNLLCFTMAEKGSLLSKANKNVNALFQWMSSQNSDAGFMISKTQLNFKNYEALCTDLVEKHGLVRDTDEVDLARLCLMNPFFMSKETKLSYPEALVDVLMSFSVSP